ncbi:MAG TPA: hypothetical protein VGX48_02920 [Pyrinomonadaceae bacterium]|nr:hypothetical protein [Pyrinomonadaceae bacterium]
MPRDPEKQREAKRRYYARNKVLYFERNKRKRDELRRIIREAKQEPCADCGGNFPYFVMDLDHREECNKVIEVAQFVALNLSKEKLIEEIGKCDVVCANCHRVRTYERGQYSGRWRVV